MNLQYMRFDKVYLDTLINTINNRFNSEVDCSQIENWIQSLDLITEFYPSCDMTSKNCCYTEELNTKKDASVLINKYFSKAPQTISAAIIVKNEERCIRRCLESVMPLFDEVVVVDTGSTDKTIDYLSSIDDSAFKLFYYDWEHDFSKARNFALTKITSQWVFFVDADEYFISSDNDDLKKLLAILALFPDINTTAICPKIVNENGSWTVDVKRIFRTDSEIKYYGLIHEEARIWKNSGWETTKSISVDITLMHDGYNDDVYRSKKKHNRNLSLSKIMLERDRDNPRWVYFYVRAALNHIPVKELETLLEKATLICPKGKIEPKNLRASEYTFALLNMWAHIALNEEELSKLNAIVICLELLYPENSNVVYYRTFREILRLKLCYRDLLTELMDYRKTHILVENWSYHNEGYHIDFLIGLLLFENRKFDSAFKYFDMLENKYMPEEYFSYIKELISICKQR